MNVPHRGGSGARSQATCIGMTIAVEEKIAPRKRAGFEFPRGACEGAVEVIVWMGVLSRKPRTATAQDGCDLGSGRATLEQFFGDPLIGDAPVRLRKALENSQPAQPPVIDLRGIGNCDRASQSVYAGRIAVRGCRHRSGWLRRQAGVTGQKVLGCFQQSSASGSQAGAGVQHLHPRRVTSPVASLWFLIGEAGQATQVAPIGAGRVATIGVRQLFADLTGEGRVDERGTDLYPGLEVAPAGLEHHTGTVPVAPHGFDNAWATVVQIDEDVTRIALLGIGMNVDVAALLVARAQKSYGGWMGELDGGPQPLSGESALGLMVNQANQEKVVRHRRELAAYRLQSEIRSTVEHGLNFAIERTRRTIKSQRTAISGLTGCLSLGVHRKSDTPTRSLSLQR
jgi:hypothetical protein